MTTFVIIEHDNKKLKSSSYHTLAAASQLKHDVCAIVMGADCQPVIEAVSKLNGVSEIKVLAHEKYKHFLPEPCCEAILETIKEEEIDYLIAPATAFGKNLLPRVAAKLGVTQVSDVIEIVDAHTFKRPIYAGNAIATVRVPKDQPICFTVRTTAFAAAVEGSHTATVTASDFVSQNQQSQFIAVECHQSNRPELMSAEIIISGGRGLQNAETFERLVKIADRLGAAIGASRAAVDSGLAPNDFQVGQTGQIVAPKLYFAVGISGAIQHLAGMKDSKIIVAINKDSDAPIFQIADYGLVADLNEVLPQWEAVLTEMGY